MPCCETFDQNPNSILEFTPDDPLMRPVSGNPGYLEPIPRFDPRSGQSPKGELVVWGEAVIKNGATEIRARNKIVGQGLRHMLNNGMLGFTANCGSGINITYPPAFETNQLTRSYMRVGVGGGATTDTTTALTAVNTTNPDSTAIANDNPSSGVYRRKFTATWNAGTLPAITVTEIGVFGFLNTVLGTIPAGSAGATTNGVALTLFARLSAADSEFTSFLVNTAVPLVIEYRVVWTFT